MPLCRAQAIPDSPAAQDRGFRLVVLEAYRHILKVTTSAFVLDFHPAPLQKVSGGCAVVKNLHPSPSWVVASCRQRLVDRGPSERDHPVQISPPELQRHGPDHSTNCGADRIPCSLKKFQHGVNCQRTKNPSQLPLVIRSRTVQKAAFFADPDVREMIAWLRERFEGNGAFCHSYRDRQSGKDWRCDGLFEAFQSYEWGGKDWWANKAELDDYRVRLRRAVAAGAEDAAVTCSLEILKWGGVIAKNGVALEARRTNWISELRHMTNVLQADHEPSRSDLILPSGSVCKMNAGFVKIYSVLLDYLVIYDGRVGAALGLLVRQFCEDTSKQAVPEPLKFAYGSPKEGMNPVSPKTRNPSTPTFKFPRLQPDPVFHSAQAMRASWLLKAALEPDPAPFSGGEKGFHELAAGLFMVGYDIPLR
jgi:hypothetical protein